MTKQSIILLGHGSRSEEARNDFNFIIETMREKAPEKNIYGAHMELASPSLQEVVAELHAQNITDIFILPYFLYNGNHIKIDIPEIIEELKAKYPEMQFELGQPIGKNPAMADIILQQVQ
ncbi:cobalamin biosynthesis protein CbiX [Prolixibacteraceae bacterium JC049]|nr:cobalamin biosynthesis protein CbiX [Prolixibacteraceae bacterium JC049]